MYLLGKTDYNIKKKRLSCVARSPIKQLSKLNCFRYCALLRSSIHSGIEICSIQLVKTFITKLLLYHLIIIGKTIFLVFKNKGF